MFLEIGFDKVIISKPSLSKSLNIFKALIDEKITVAVAFVKINIYALQDHNIFDLQRIYRTSPIISENAKTRIGNINVLIFLKVMLKANLEYLKADVLIYSPLFNILNAVMYSHNWFLLKFNYCLNCPYE
nr:hypothetical protein [Mycoplasmopsis bovis]